MHVHYFTGNDREKNYIKQRPNIIFEYMLNVGNRWVTDTE